MSFNIGFIHFNLKKKKHSTLFPSVPAAIRAAPDGSSLLQKWRARRGGEAGGGGEGCTVV